MVKWILNPIYYLENISIFLLIKYKHLKMIQSLFSCVHTYSMEACNSLLCGKSRKHFIPWKHATLSSARAELHWDQGGPWPPGQ